MSCPKLEPHHPHHGVVEMGQDYRFQGTLGYSIKEGEQKVDE